MSNFKGCCDNPQPRQRGMVIESIQGTILKDDTEYKCDNCGHVITSNEEFKRLQMIEAWNDARAKYNHKPERTIQ